MTVVVTASATVVGDSFGVVVDLENSDVGNVVTAGKVVSVAVVSIRVVVDVDDMVVAAGVVETLVDDNDVIAVVTSFCEGKDVLVVVVESDAI